jgi:hypothetical protein
LNYYEGKSIPSLVTTLGVRSFFKDVNLTF